MKRNLEVLPEWKYFRLVVVFALTDHRNLIEQSPRRDPGPCMQAKRAGPCKSMCGLAIAKPLCSSKSAIGGLCTLREPVR